MENRIDYALAVAEIYPAAKFRRADTYAVLAQTWSDERPLPSEQVLREAWSNIKDRPAPLTLEDRVRALEIEVFGS